MTLWEIAPRALNVYKLAFERRPEVLPAFGIEGPNRLAHFLAQVLHETGGLTLTSENLNYSADRLMVVWPSRFPTLSSAQPFAANPRALANKVYGSRLGNIKIDDGWNFRGRGLLQLTGRAGYKAVGTALGLDLTANPALVLDPEHALAVAACVWRESGCSEVADTDERTPESTSRVLAQVTRLINGGHTGLHERAQWLDKIRRGMEL